MKWTDTFVIARYLAETYPEVDPASIGPTDLRAWILKIGSFADAPERCTRYILEAIQSAWIQESGSWHIDT